ncbi:MAG: YIP1 family protein [Rhodobacteraceae bacterium]|nr:MAG: YIP1 family protein [Paracoccaceae bacterium]
MSLMRNIARSYRAPGRVVAALDAQGVREPQLLFFLCLACGLIFLSQWPVLSRAAALDPSISFEQRLGGALFGVMFMLPLILYGVAGLLQLGMRLVSGPVAGLRVRLALFWALVAIAPLMLVHGGLRGFLGSSLAVQLFGFVVLAAFLYILGAGLRSVARLTREGAG